MVNDSRTRYTAPSGWVLLATRTSSTKLHVTASIAIERGCRTALRASVTCGRNGLAILDPVDREVFSPGANPDSVSRSCSLRASAATPGGGRAGAAQRMCAARQYSRCSKTSSTAGGSWGGEGSSSGMEAATRRAIAASSGSRLCGTEPRKARVTCRFSSDTRRPPLACAASLVACAMAARILSSGHSAKKSRRVGSGAAAPVGSATPAGDRSATPAPQQPQEEAQGVVDRSTAHMVPVPREVPQLAYRRGCARFGRGDAKPDGAHRLLGRTPIRARDATDRDGRLDAGGLERAIGHLADRRLTHRPVLVQR